MKIGAAEVLESYNQQARQQMARQQGVDAKGKTKADLIAALAPGLFDPGRIARALADLSAEERALLDELALVGGEADTDQVRGVLEQDGRIEPRPKPGAAYSYDRRTGSPWARHSRKFEDLVARLGALGLVFTAERDYGAQELATPGRRLYIPDAIMAHLPAVTIVTETTGPPPLIRAADPAAFLYDLSMLLSTAEETAIPVTKAGLVAKRGLLALNGALRVQEDAAAARGEEDLPRLSLLRALAEQLRLVSPREGKLVVAPAAADFLALPPEERRGRLFLAYAETPLWCELSHVPDLTVRGGAAHRPAPPQVAAARQRVLAELAELPGERWILLHHLIARLYRRAYGFLLPRERRRSYYGYGYGYAGDSPYYGENPMGWSFEWSTAGPGWPRVEGGFIEAVVTRALFWLGLVDLGEQDGAPVSFRITPDGLRLLHGERLPATPAPAPNVVVQPNFQVFAFEPTDESVLFRLSRLAERVRAEQASEFAITRASIFRALQAGWETAGILDFLDQVSSVPLPQNVRRSIEEWGAEQERIIVRRSAALVQTVDAATLDTLYADAALAPLLGRRLAPTAALLSPGNFLALHQKLIERGQLPALTEGPGDQPGAAFSVGPSGAIRFLAPAPSLYVQGALRPFTEAGDDGQPRLTPASLRRAAKEGRTAAAILATLADYSRGPPPAEVEQMVGRWGKDWGRAALAEAVLLQVEQPETLQELLTEPALKGKVRPVPGLATLAVVPPAAVDAVRAALADRGIEWQPTLLPASGRESRKVE